MTDLYDLTETLALAAAEAVRARRGAIEAGGEGHLRGITIEVETANGGTVLDVTSYLTWRQTRRST
jgi:hypothetical protein